MFILKSIWCRLYQGAFRLALPVLPYREPKIIPSCAALDAVLVKEGVRSALIVTDAGILRNGLTRSLEETLARCNIPCVIYSETQPNPTVHNVETARRLYLENNCDCLIAIGGGSAMDCAKAVGARIARPRTKLNKLGGVLRVLHRIPLLIAIPTTAGTGSEVTLAAVITDPGQQHKYAMMDFSLIPRYAVLDPSLTCTLPAHLTASTGMDALTHAVEAFIGRSTTRKTRRLALEAADLILHNIEQAYSDGSDLAARKNMLHAAYKAGIAFSMSYVGYVHAAAHALGGRYGTPHGLANAVILPYMLESYGACIHKKLKAFAVHTGLCGESCPADLAAKRFIDKVRALNAAMGIPETLPGIAPADIPALALHAEKEANPLYPVPKLMTAKELEAFFHYIS